MGMGILYYEPNQFFKTKEKSQKNFLYFWDLKKIQMIDSNEIKIIVSTRYERRILLKEMLHVLNKLKLELKAFKRAHKYSVC